MKKIITFAAGLLLATAVHAQQVNDAPKNAISISYGIEPLYSLGDAFANALGTAFSSIITVPLGGTVEMSDKKNYGTANFDFTHHFSPLIAVGVNASFSYTKGDILNVHMEGETSPSGTVYHETSREKIGDSKATYLTFMPTIKFDWFRREHITLYSRFSAGVMFARTTKKVSTSSVQSDETDKKAVFELQASPIGVEGGSNHLRAFAEAGFGQCGIGQIGVRARF